MEGEIAMTKASSAFRHLDLAENSNRNASSQSSFYDAHYRGSPSSTDSFQTRSVIEADMSDSAFDFPLRKQCSTSVLQSPIHRLGVSASHPNLNVECRASTTPPPTTPGLDMTEKEDKYLTMEPTDLTNFRKWIVGFCIVNFDLEIGQGKALFNIIHSLTFSLTFFPLF